MKNSGKLLQAATQQHADMRIVSIRHLYTLITELVVAEVEDSWKGGGDPKDIPAIEADLKIARLDLENYLQRCPAAPAS